MECVPSAHWPYLVVSSMHAPCHAHPLPCMLPCHVRPPVDRHTPVKTKRSQTLFAGDKNVNALWNFYCSPINVFVLIGVSNGGASGRPPTVQQFLIFAQFFFIWRIWQNYISYVAPPDPRVAPPPGIWDSPLVLVIVGYASGSLNFQIFLFGW